MKYNFDELTDRRHTGSYKWDSAVGEDVLPMWVADMDFQTVPVIIEALQKRVAHGIFGYTKVPDTYYEAIIRWFSRQHGWSIDREWIQYTIGGVPALSAIIKAMTCPRDKVVVQTPVYNCFFSSIRNNGCEIVTSPLLREGDTYRVDYADLEEKVSDPKVKLFLLCNPHNPAGRVWTPEELRCMGEICFRHDVFVVADEIHCELVMPGYVYTPFASLGEKFLQHSATCISPSKAFNLAGLQIANIVLWSEELRKKVDRAININEVCDVNPFGVAALIAAYSEEGAEWLKQLNAYIAGNYQYMQHFCNERLPQFPLIKLEGTYLAWMDCSVLALNAEEIETQLLDEEKLWLNAGTMYGEAGEGFMRWNLACPRSRVEEGLRRFSCFVEKKVKKN